ncbi:hypothetical protein SAMN05428952_10144 [Nitrosomonas sp. Nm132]|nr:hypothetical protein SAMN05428952_10144 [Nitrosomonas sp. Nm132]
MLLHFLIRILPNEHPLDRSALGITPLLPGIRLSSERVAVVPASIQTLPIKDADLDLRHVEPSWRVSGCSGIRRDAAAPLPPQYQALPRNNDESGC